MAKPQERFLQDTIALVYDFDGTLTPQPMQEYTVFAEMGIDPKRFWAEVKKAKVETHGDEILTYMRLLIDRFEEQKVHWDRKAFRRAADKIRYFPGVEAWFPRINEYVRKRSGGKVKVKHYIISAGMKEILDGIKLRKHFERIYACEYFFDHHNCPKFPKVVINDTNKTQFIFRINKGREKLEESINEHMAESDRPIPFQNIIYFGDGMTDVPCMTVATKSGGHAVAVHKKGSTKGIAICKRLMNAGRINYFAPADYRADQLLDKRVKILLDLIIANISYGREVFDCKKKAAR